MDDKVSWKCREICMYHVTISNCDHAEVLSCLMFQKNKKMFSKIYNYLSCLLHEVTSCWVRDDVDVGYGSIGSYVRAGKFT